MAQISGFTELLQKLKLIRIEDDDSSADAQQDVYTAPAKRSIYEQNYNTRSGASGRTRNEKRSYASKGMAVRENKPVHKADTMVYYISSLSECAAVIRDIIGGISAVINFDDTDDRMSQRIIDTLAGAAFALNAKIRKITDSTYLIAPENVNVNTSRHIDRRY